MQYLIKKELSPLEMLAVVSHSKGYIGSSMHGAITTYSYKKPILMLNMKKTVKVSGFLDLINLKHCQVNNLNEIDDIYKNYFIRKEFKTHKEIKKDIDNHFAQISKNISSYKFNNDSHYLENVLYASLSDAQLKSPNNFTYARVFIDNGHGYNEEDVEYVKIYNNKGISITKCINESAKSIRIDIIENEFINIKTMTIKLNNKIIDYFIPNSIKMNDKSIFIHSLDPQIIINDLKPGKLELNANIEIVGKNKQEQIANELASSLSKTDELEKQYANLLNAYKKTVRYKIAKLLKH